MNTPTKESWRLNIGDKVRWSGYAIKPRRDYWLSCGSYSAKSAAKQALDDMSNIRGEITRVYKSKQGANCVEVTWFDGSRHDCLDHLVMKTLQ